MVDHAYPQKPAARKTWLWLLPLVILAVLACGWSTFWFYASGQAERQMEGWLAREAKAGRVYVCGNQAFGGFPFRFEIRCANTSVELATTHPPLSVKTADIVAAMQVYQPNLLIAEITSPMTIATSGEAPALQANWSQASASARGTPQNPQRISLVFEDPVIERLDQPGIRLFSGKHVGVHGRIASGSASDHPVVDIAAKLVATTAPTLHPLLAQPFNADLDANLVGLKDFAPKPWPERFRELQQNGGRIDVRNVRIQQNDLLATAAGSLSLNENGRLDGELQLTAAGLDKVLPTLGIDQLTRPGSAANERLGSALNALDKLVPGLGNIARERAGAGAAAAIAMMGQQTELEGRPARRLPLRFTDGEIYLGSIRVGQVGALY